MENNNDDNDIDVTTKSSSSSSAAAATTTDLLSLQEQLKEASESAVELVKHYISLYDTEEGPDNENNPWKNPDQMFTKLKEKRNALNQIWQQYEKQMLAGLKEEEEEGPSRQEPQDLPEEEFNVL
jgi:hypothetical protein